MDIDDCLAKYEFWNLSVMPLFPRTKQPCLSSWKDYVLRRPDLDQIWKWKETYWNPGFWVDVWQGKRDPKLKERWIKALHEDWKKADVEDELGGWSYDNTLGLAVIGSPSASDGLVLIDIEDISLLPEDDQVAIKGDGWQSAVVKTGKANGYHLYIKFPPGIAKNTKGANGEIRAFGQYVAAPPTVHPNGAPYLFVKDIKIGRVDKENAEGLYKHLQKLISIKEDKLLVFARKLPVEVGKRSDWIVALTAYYKAKGMNIEEAYDLLLTVPICSDKLKENGFDWWKEYEWDYLDGCTLENGISGLLFSASEQSCIPFNEEIKKEIKAVDAGLKGGITFDDACIPIEDKRTKEIIDFKFSPSKAADAVLKSFKIITTEDEIEWIYRDGIFVPKAVSVIDKILDRICRDKYNINAAREIHKKIRIRTYVEGWPFDPDPFRFGAANAVINLRDGSIEAYRPEHLITLRSPVVYDPEATCPEIEKFLAKTLLGEDIKTVIDLFVSMCCTVAFEHFVCLVGVGSNGKKVLETLIESFFGADQISAVRIEELGSNPFIRADLIGKRALINSEVTGDKKESNWIKAISSGDIIDSDRKNRSRIRFKPYCLIIFDTNNPPRFHDNSNGFMRRFIKIDFPFIFVNEPSEDNPREKKRDPDLITKITNPTELSGLLNLIINRAPEIIEKKEIYTRKTGKQMLEEYDRQSYSVSTFLDEFCETTLKASFISSECIYDQYCRYCIAINATPKHNNAFFKSVSKLPTVRRVNQSEETNWKRGYSGVIVKKDLLDEFISSLESSPSFPSGESGEIRRNQNKYDTASVNQENTCNTCNTETFLETSPKYSEKKFKNADFADANEADSGHESSFASAQNDLLKGITNLGSPKKDPADAYSDLFHPSQDEVLLKAITYMKRGRMLVNGYTLADIVRGWGYKILPSDCENWLSSRGEKN